MFAMYIKSSDDQSYLSTEVQNEHQPVQQNDGHDTQTHNLRKRAQSINLIEGAEQSKVVTNHSRSMMFQSGSSLEHLDEIALQRPVTPRACDILSGRGKFINQHYGNKVYREVVSEHKHAYVQANKSDKERIAKQVKAEVLDRLQMGGEGVPRFIKNIKTTQSEDKWYPLSESETLNKIKQSLREGMSHVKQQMTSRLADNVGDKASSDGSLKRGLPSDFAAERNTHKAAPKPPKRQKTSESSNRDLNPEASVSVVASQDKPHAEPRYDFDQLEAILPDELDSVSEFLQSDNEPLSDSLSSISDLMPDRIALSPEVTITGLPGLEWSRIDREGDDVTRFLSGYNPHRDTLSEWASTATRPSVAQRAGQQDVHPTESDIVINTKEDFNSATIAFLKLLKQNMQRYFVDTSVVDKMAMIKGVYDATINQNQSARF